MTHPPELPPTLPSFYRAHGLGNDYLVFEAAGVSGELERGAASDGAIWRPTPRAVRAICQRWTGVGADGIVILGDPAAVERFPLRMFNPDGSEFERSGNGLRILASHLFRTGRVQTDPFAVVSGGSHIGMQVHSALPGGIYDVSVEMGRAAVGGAAVGFEQEGRGEVLAHPVLGDVAIRPVSVGNPHAVVFTDDLSDRALNELGPFLSKHPAFAHGTNVQLAHVLGPDEVRIAIWERGVGRTSASGTSSCAVAVAGVHDGHLRPGTIQVVMDGGTLRVDVTPSLDVVLRGPVQEVATGRLMKGFLESIARS